MHQFTSTYSKTFVVVVCPLEYSIFRRNKNLKKKNGGMGAAATIRESVKLDK